MKPLRHLLCLSLLLQMMTPVSALTPPKWLTTLLPGGKKTELAVRKRVSIGSINGGTGQSAQRALVAELTTSREFDLTVEKPDYIITGTSVGGRMSGRITDAQGKEIMARTYAAPGLDENIKAFADDLIFAITGKPGLATSRIIFVSDKTGTKQIFICDSQGHDVQQVTNHPHGCVSPSINLDASAIAYTTYRTGFPTVQIMDLAQGWDRSVTDTPGSSFGAAFSPDGNRLAIVMSFLGNPEIFVTDLASNTAACLSDSTGAPGSPTWHPDGKQIIFSDDRGDGPRLYVSGVPDANDSATQLVRWRTGYSFNTDPEFSPDGTSVAFTARIGGEMAVIVKKWPKGSSSIIAKSGATHPSWSPNGRYLCYVQHGTLYAHHLPSGQRRAILSDYGHITEPRWMK